MKDTHSQSAHFPPLQEIVQALSDPMNRADFYHQISSIRDEKEPVINAFEQVASLLPKHTNGPFNGLPVTVKDQIAVAGWPRWFGLDRINKRKDKSSAQLIATLQDLGCVICGKTALPPHALDLQTFNSRRGYTENPHRYGFTVGGSSGGGAAAVATGMSVLDIGADLAGSLRLPAAWCGVTSLVPTEGRLDSSGMLPNGHRVEHFARLGPIARTAEDLRFFWRTLTGELHPSQPEQNLRLRIWAPSARPQVESQISDLWSQMMDALHEGSFQIDTDKMDEVLTPETYRLFGEIMGYETGATLPFFIRWLLRRDRDAVAHSPEFLQHVYEGYRRDRRRHAKNLETLSAFRERMLTLFKDCDAILMPVAGVAAFQHLEPIKDRGGVRTYDKKFETLAGPKPYLDALTYFTVPVSLMGWPVITLPFAVDRNGLPVGLQLVGKPDTEAKLAAIACDLERIISFGHLRGSQ